MDIELPPRRKRERPQKRFMDVPKEDMVGVTEEDAMNGEKESHDPLLRPPKEKKKDLLMRYRV